MLQNCNVVKVAACFFYEPTKEHYLKEISKKTNLAHTSVKNYLIELKHAGIITERIDKKGSRKFPLYKANIEYAAYKRYKALFNIINLYESGMVEHLKDNFMPKSIVLFGSYQRGEDLEDSDIDLFVECKKEEISLDKFKKKLHRNIQLHFKDKFNDYPAQLKNNIINGVVLHGYLEAF